ncbi:MAG: RdgB/HAM1 family non-canonical purine NTP pyrophosphatase [Clostridia bacterium]|nr:RdgB/HAM1 family non-canonical purine NTP pyrophosphatase [Clostridia bacterium]
MGKKMAILAATGNTHKMREFQQIFQEILTRHEDWTIDVFAEKELAKRANVSYEAPEETGTIFRENAEIKAVGIADFLEQHPAGYPEGYDQMVIIADDSGICVEALGGKPGVYSARYAQKPGVPGNSDDGANLQKLLHDMEHVPDDQRQAAFVCSIVGIVPGEGTRKTLYAEGRIEGMLTREPKGERGFGYDPIFYVEQFCKTTAELTAEEKNAISHRGQALRDLAEQVYGILTVM